MDPKLQWGKAAGLALVTGELCSDPGGSIQTGINPGQGLKEMERDEARAHARFQFFCCLDSEYGNTAAGSRIGGML
eukprot:1771908-Amphidinium_carterae.1